MTMTADSGFAVIGPIAMVQGMGLISSTYRKCGGEVMLERQFLQGEQLISLKDVPNYLPKRNGKRMHYSTVFRWATKGTRGRKLESLLVGGVRYTSLEAISRFTSPQECVANENSQIIAQILADEGI